MKWFKNDEEIVPDKRVQVVKDGRKRKLVIKDAKVTDAGQYACVSNADKTQAEIVINCKYLFHEYINVLRVGSHWKMSIVTNFNIFTVISVIF